MRYKSLHRIILFWVFLVALVALLGDISVAESDGGRTAATFLQIGTGARSAGLGGAYTAVADGAEAAYWNPAGLASLENNEISLGHFAWYQDISLEHGSVAFSTSDNTTIAASITYLDYGTIDGYDFDGNSTGELNAYDLAGSISFGMRVSDNISVGLTGKYIAQNLDDVSGSALAADIGVRWESEKVIVAGVIANVGSDMKWDETSEKLPGSTRLGVAFRPFARQVMTSIEIEKPTHGSVLVRHGIETGFSDQYFLRAGYNRSVSSDDRAYPNSMSLGMGLKFGEFAVDYAYTLQDDVSSEDLHRFSMGFGF